jgi:ubiquitin C-terminal hydrolase
MSLSVSLLMNVGNTCYLNSVLQILLNNRELILRLRDFPHRSGLILEFLKMVESNGSPFNTSGFVNLLQNRVKMRLRQQNDAHEIFLLIVEIFKNESPVFNEFFNGKYKTNYICCNCGNKRSNLEDFISIPLFPKATMKESIEDYIKTEYFEEIFCENCDKKVKTKKKIKIQTFPKILIFQIIRFISINKIEHHERLLIHKNKYSFQGIVNHVGTLDCGHYTYTDSINVYDDENTYKMNKMTPKDHYLIVYSK